MEMHQVICLFPAKLTYRDVSCVCGVNGKMNCPYYEPAQFVIEAAVNLALYTVQNVGTDMMDTIGQAQTQNPTTDNTLAEKQIKTSHSSLNETDTLQMPDFLSEPDIGRFCVVIYDQIPYPGEILNVDEGEVEVSCMKSLGRNKICWPSPKKDINWYTDGDVTCLIPEPQQETERSRFYQVERRIWANIEKQFQTYIE